MARDATRRRVLAIGAVTLPLAVAGCKGLGALGAPPKPAPGVAVVGHAITVETRLIAHYGAVLAAVPALAGQPPCVARAAIPGRGPLLPQAPRPDRRHRH